MLRFGCARSVAGVYAPAFVERAPSHEYRRHHLEVSPEFMLRPSLSASEDAPAGDRRRRRVAGVYAPAFVERAAAGAYRHVSPEFMLRPSFRCTEHRQRVAGVYAPAFVERMPVVTDRRGAARCRRSLCSGLR